MEIHGANQGRPADWLFMLAKRIAPKRNKHDNKHDTRQEMAVSKGVIYCYMVKLFQPDHLASIYIESLSR